MFILPRSCFSTYYIIVSMESNLNNTFEIYPSLAFIFIYLSFPFSMPLTSAIALYFSLGSPLELSNRLELLPHVQPLPPWRLFFASLWPVATYYEESIRLFCQRLSVSSLIVYFNVMVIFVACNYWFCAPLVYKITLVHDFVFIITSPPICLGNCFAFFLCMQFSIGLST